MTQFDDIQRLVRLARRRLADVDIALAVSTSAASKALAEVAEVVAQAQALLRAADEGLGQPETVKITQVVLGISPAPIGWVGVIRDPQAPRPRVVAGEHLGELIESARESLRLDVVSIGTEPSPEVDLWVETQPALRHHVQTPIEIWRGVSNRGAAQVSASDQWQNRFAALTGAGHPAPSLLSGIGFAETHVVDAYAAALAWSPPQ
ncbi:hypothetical protein K0651_12910 [Ornithinimicrobium sp. Arc0846-15]|nr:hypothetical protein [Ornithinimicrobium laminariae]